MNDDLKDYRAPLGSFQVLAPAVAEFAFIVLCAVLLVFFVVPDVIAWWNGAQPVGICK